MLRNAVPPLLLSSKAGDCRPEELDSLTISKLSNNMAETTVIIWYRKHPNDIRTWMIKENNIHESPPIPIPFIQKKEDLIGTHLEVQLMNKELSHCFLRTLFWIHIKYPHNLFMATPNDTHRDIDNMHNDLIVTKRYFPISTVNIEIVLKKTQGDYYVEINQKSIPIEYLY